MHFPRKEIFYVTFWTFVLNNMWIYMYNFVIKAPTYHKTSFLFHEFRHEMLIYFAKLYPKTTLLVREIGHSISPKNPTSNDAHCVEGMRKAREYLDWRTAWWRYQAYLTHASRYLKIITIFNNSLCVIMDKKYVIQCAVCGCIPSKSIQQFIHYCALLWI